jgi:proteasome lid subunit RPN8/RPN11
VESVLEVTNQAQSAVRFVMNPIEQLKAFEWIESNGLDLIGIFHSHPAGPETVSPTDIADAAYAVAHVVLARVDGAWRARGFWIKDGAVSEVSLQIR